MKIAFVLLRTLGDVVLGNTLVREVKEKYPDSEITYFVQEGYEDIIKNNPDIKEVVSVKKVDDKIDIDSLLLELAKEKWDEVIYPYQTSWVDNIWHHRPKYKRCHLIHYYCYQSDIGLEDFKLYMYPKPEDEVEAEDNVIAVHGTTLNPSKDWNKFNQLVPLLKAKGYKVVQVGAESDTSIAGTEDLRGKYTFNQLYCFFKKCKYFIGLDSGLSYIASASGTKCVILMGCTIPRTSGPVGINVKQVVSYTKPECVPQRCHSNCKYGDPCINKIDVSKVMSKIDLYEEEK